MILKRYECTVCNAKFNDGNAPLSVNCVSSIIQAPSFMGADSGTRKTSNDTPNRIKIATTSIALYEPVRSYSSPGTQDPTAPPSWWLTEMTPSMTPVE